MLGELHIDLLEQVISWLDKWDASNVMIIPLEPGH